MMIGVTLPALSEVGEVTEGAAEEAAPPAGREPMLTPCGVAWPEIVFDELVASWLNRFLEDESGMGTGTTATPVELVESVTV